MLSRYITEVIFVAINLALADWHYQLIKKNKPIVHWEWGILYGCLCATVWFLFEKWQLVVACVLIREAVFSPFLNYIRGKPFFYTDTKSPKPSFLDVVEGKSVAAIYFISLAGLILVQFFL